MESLADASLATMKRFKLLQEVDIWPDKNQSGEWPKHLFLAQFDRFELWAVNLGVFVMGHGSLDYRIRDSENMKESILKMIRNLDRSLDEVLEYLNGNIDREDVGSDTDSDSERESDSEILLDGIKDPIDRLYKMAVWIRNPATRLPSSKARHFQQIDEETDVDLFKSYNNFDYDYVSSLFLEYEKNKALQESPTVQYRNTVDDDTGSDAEDRVWEPIRKTLEQNRLNRSNGDEYYLVGRIARAIGLRRRQFAYWRKHRDKLREHATVAVEVPTHNLPTTNHIIQDETKIPKAPLSVTTATQLRLSHGIGKEFEKESVVNTVSEYAPSAWNPSKDIVSFPSPPKASTDDGFFECPYCFTICPSSLLSEKAWRAHLIRDLRPYICTYEQCLTPEQLYDTRDDWIQHETSTHQTIFRCPRHEEETFVTSAAYKEHTQEHHKDAITWDFAASPLIHTSRSCPVCSVVLGTLQKLQSHIALHLERFAMFSLPRCPDGINEGDSEGQSAGAQFESDRSLSGDPDTASNATGQAADGNLTNYAILEKIRSMSQRVVMLRSLSSESNDQYFLEEMGKIRDQLKRYGKLIRTWPLSDTVNTFLFEFGEICIDAGLVEEAIETLNYLKFLQNSQLKHDDPMRLRTSQKLMLAYEINGTLQEAKRQLEDGADLHTESSKDKALHIFARTEAGLRYAETIWGMHIRNATSCYRCQIRNTRCDRLMPSCLRCIRGGLSCDYNTKDAAVLSAAAAAASGVHSAAANSVPSTSTNPLELVRAAQPLSASLPCTRCLRLKVVCDMELPCDRCRSSGNGMGCRYMSRTASTEGPEPRTNIDTNGMPIEGTLASVPEEYRYFNVWEAGQRSMNDDDAVTKTNVLEEDKPALARLRERQARSDALNIREEQVAREARRINERRGEVIEIVQIMRAEAEHAEQVVREAQGGVAREARESRKRRALAERAKRVE